MEGGLQTKVEDERIGGGTIDADLRFSSGAFGGRDVASDQTSIAGRRQER